MSGAPPGPRARPLDAPSLLAILLVVCTLASAALLGASSPGIDFYQFWLVGRAARTEGTGNVWTAAERDRLGREGLLDAEAGAPPDQPSRRLRAARRRRTLETYSTPWLYTVFGAAATGDYEIDFRSFHVASVLALAGGVTLLARCAGLSWIATALLVSVSVAGMAPAASDARVGNVNGLLLGMLAASIWIGGRLDWRVRDLLAGGVLGMAAMFKPNLAFPVLTLGLGWLFTGRYRKLSGQCAGIAAGAALAFVLSSAWFSTPRAWLQWWAVLGELMGEYDHALARGNFSLVRILRDHAGAGAWIGAVVLAVLMVLVVGGLVMRRRACDAGCGDARRDDLLFAGLGAAVSLLAARLAWLHYFVLVLPLAAWTLRPEARPAVRAAGVVGLAMVALVPFQALFGFAESSTAAAVITCGGALVLLATALVDLATDPRARGKRQAEAA